MTRKIKVSNQDYSLIKNTTKRVTEEMGVEYNFRETSIGFEFLVLERIFKMQEDEIVDSITDTIFLQKFIDEDSGPDRGIDAIYLDTENGIINLFNFKYTEQDISKAKDVNFPSKEINNVIVFIKDVFEKNEHAFDNNSANDKLTEKVKEIWKLIDEGSIFKFKVYFVANLFNGFAEDEHLRFEHEIKSYRGDVSFEYILVSDIVDSLINRSGIINGKIKALSSNYFERAEAGNRALILELSANDLMRITSSDEAIRDNLEVDDSVILKSKIEESVFDDNVRVYLKQRTNINKNIKKTALDDEESSKIFFYNNGITITCDKIHYQGRRNQTITLNNFQIVNGGQTVHALRSAFEENRDNFDRITVLCKIYETVNSEFKGKIAEYTNSQNPVKDRDVRSIDIVQIKLEKEFENLGFYYERKKNQFESKPRNSKIDSEKLGQASLAYKFEMLGEAKNRKSIIFGEKYDDIFNDNLSVKEALLIFELYKFIEKQKLINKDKKPYLMHATYYIMYFIKKLSSTLEEKEFIEKYDLALEKIEYIIKKEKGRLGENYLDAVLFKYNRSKDYLTELGL